MNNPVAILNLFQSELTNKIRDQLKMYEIVDFESRRFNDGEYFIKIDTNVRHKNVYILADIKPDDLLPTMIAVDTLRRAHAEKITLVIPFLPYSRQDRRADTRTPISARILADLLQTSGVDHVITMDIHSLQGEGFYKIPFDNLQGTDLLVRTMLHQLNWWSGPANKPESVFVAPDAGAAKRVQKIADRFGKNSVIIHKHRYDDKNVRSQLLGDVRGKCCIILDDMIATGGTIVEAKKTLEKNGALAVAAGCIHGVFSGDAMEKLSPAFGGQNKTLFSLNTIPQRVTTGINKIVCNIDCSEIFINAIHNDIHGKSISSMFS